VKQIRKNGIIKPKHRENEIVRAARDWSELYCKYKSQWAALDEARNTVIANGTSRQDTKETAAKLGHSDILILRVPDEINYEDGYVRVVQASVRQTPKSRGEL
jgi:hypothetical protein